MKNLKHKNLNSMTILPLRKNQAFQKWQKIFKNLEKLNKFIAIISSNFGQFQSIWRLPRKELKEKS